MKKNVAMLALVLLAWTLSCRAFATIRIAAETPEATVVEPSPEPADPRLVSPYGTVVRSLIVPGWGQIHIRERFQGLAFLTGIGGLATAWAISYSDFRQQYNDVYLPEVEKNGVSSASANAIYADVNRRFKTSRFLLFTTLGVWGYALIDAYVDANIYNAEIRAEDVIEDSNEIRKLEVGWHRNAPIVRYRVAFR